MLVSSPLRPPNVRTGLDRVLDRPGLLARQRVGLVTNASAVTSTVVPAVDALRGACALVALFSPEHGLAAHAADGAPVGSTRDTRTHLPVYSLYGESKRPSAEMLHGIDILVFDIQDVGARFYTYVWTMSHVLEAAAEHRLPVIVLDRPNPITGTICEGPLLEPGYQSFVGRYPNFDLLIGNSWVRAELDQGTRIEDLATRWHGELTSFHSQRQPYLLYE